MVNNALRFYLEKLRETEPNEAMIDLEPIDAKELNHCFDLCRTVQQVEWLTEFAKRTGFEIDIASHFEYSCGLSSAAIAKWIYERCEMTNELCDKAFKRAALGCNPNIAKWIYSIESDRIEMTAELCERVFKQTFNNNGDIAKWIYSIGTDRINNFEEVFCSIASSMHMDKQLCENVQWLYSEAESRGKPINVRVKNDLVFRAVCNSSIHIYKEGIDIAQWLQTVCNSYTVTIKKDVCGRYIDSYTIVTPLQDKIMDAIKRNQPIDLTFNSFSAKRTAKVIDNSDKYICPLCLGDTNTVMIQLLCSHRVCTNCYVTFDLTNENSGCSVTTCSFDGAEDAIIFDDLDL